MPSSVLNMHACYSSVDNNDYQWASLIKIWFNDSTSCPYFHQCRWILMICRDRGGFRAILIITMTGMNSSAAGRYIRGNTHCYRWYTVDVVGLLHHRLDVNHWTLISFFFFCCCTFTASDIYSEAIRKSSISEVMPEIQLHVSTENPQSKLILSDLLETWRGFELIDSVVLLSGL